MSWWRATKKRCRIVRGALSLDQCQSLQKAIVESPWLAGTTLNRRFASTWGFSVAFQRHGLARVRKTFGEFIPYLDLVIEEPYNAFFLNPLVIFRGGQVMPHIDCSIRSYTAPLEPPYPGKVSVFYAQVPSDLEGGQLLLSSSGHKEIARVQPEQNMLVQFDGELMHQVTPFEGSAQADLQRSRISLVCEHYVLPDALLARVPDFHLETTRDFQEFLQHALEVEGIGNEP